MGIRQYKPVTAGRRQGSVSDFAEITDRKKKPEKSLLLPKPKKGGRNFQGVICTHGPTGCLSVSTRPAPLPAMLNWPWMRVASPANQRKNSAA